MVSPQKMSSTQIKTGTCCLNCGITINDHTVFLDSYFFCCCSFESLKKTNPGTYNNGNNLKKNAVVFCCKALLILILKGAI